MVGAKVAATKSEAHTLRPLGVRALRGHTVNVVGPPQPGHSDSGTAPSPMCGVRTIIRGTAGYGVAPGLAGQKIGVPNFLERA